MIHKRCFKKYASNKGFTLLELLIVIGLTVSIVAVSVPMYENLHTSTKLDEGLAQIMSEIRLAREKSMAGINNEGHGVYFDPGNNKLVQFEGASYAARNTDNDRELIVDSNIIMSTTIVFNEINFERGNGVPDAVGQVELSLNEKSRTIEINDFGIVLEINE